MRLAIIFLFALSLFGKLHSANPKSFYCLLVKDSHPGQYYIISEKWPKQLIARKIKQNYRIKYVQYKLKSFFVVMEKNSENIRWQCIHNANYDLLREKEEDGFSITDAAVYHNPDGYLCTIYVLDKIAYDKVPKSGFLAEPFSEAEKVVNNWWYDGRGCKVVKSSSTSYYVAVFYQRYAEDVAQISTYRSEYPSEFIRNKTREGFMVRSITYNKQRNLWYVVMQTNINNHNWKMVELKDPELSKAFLREVKENGYRVAGVF
jgi:hypothetical protein